MDARRRIGLLVGVMTIALLAAGCTRVGAAPGATLDCGKIQTRGPNPPAEANARQAENCFWSAYQQAQNARLVVTITGVDTVETHTLALGHNNGRASITDTVERQIVPARPLPTQTYTCTSLTQKQTGLLFQSCGGEGDLFVPAPVG